MRRKFPTPETMKTILCDLVRLELNKKLSFLGVYAGDKIVFHPTAPDEPPFRMQGLAFVFLFKDGLGDFKARFSIKDPHGKTHYETNLNPLRFEKGQAAICIVQIANLEFVSEGQYCATLALERKKYAFEFAVSTAASEQAA